jgi:hypothetical protein
LSEFNFLLALPIFSDRHHIRLCNGMRVDLTPTRSATTIATSSGSLLSDWRVGAIVEAVAVRDVSGQLWLRIGNTNFSARVASGASEGPANGEVLQARVLRTSPVLALETLQSQQPESATEVTANALLRYLPKQSSPANLAANLGFIARGQGEDLPEGVRRAATQLWQALPDTQALSDPAELEQALTRSGTFLENTLARGQAPAGDLKGLLLALQNALSSAGARANAASPPMLDNGALPRPDGALASLPATPASLALLDGARDQLNELARQVEGTLARLTTTQIQNTTQSSTPSAVMIELPVRVDDRASMLRLRIEREASQERQEGDSSWTIEAALDLGAQGGLHARISLTGSRLAVQLRADSAFVVEELAARSPELASLLRESGLSIDRIVCLHGMPVSPASKPVHRLLDVRA